MNKFGLELLPPSDMIRQDTHTHTHTRIRTLNPTRLAFQRGGHLLETSAPFRALIRALRRSRPLCSSLHFPLGLVSPIVNSTYTHMAHSLCTRARSSLTVKTRLSHAPSCRRTARPTPCTKTSDGSTFNNRPPGCRVYRRRASAGTLRSGMCAARDACLDPCVL